MALLFPHLLDTADVRFRALKLWSAYGQHICTLDCVISTLSVAHVNGVSLDKLPAYLDSSEGHQIAGAVDYMEQDRFGGTILGLLSRSIACLGAVHEYAYLGDVHRDNIMCAFDVTDDRG